MGSSDLAHHEEQSRLASLLSKELFRQAKRDAEFRRVLGQKERMVEYTKLLYQRALHIRRERDYPLSDDVIYEVARRIADRVTTWQHHPELQSKRGRRSGAARRRKRKGRDAQILYLADVGLSNRNIAKEFNMSESTVRYVLKRDEHMRLTARTQAQAEKIKRLYG